MPTTVSGTERWRARRDVACPGCCSLDGIAPVRRIGTEDVRGMRIPVTKLLRHCRDCDAEFEDRHDPDWRLDLYAAYRLAMGMTTPEAVVSWRGGHGLDVEQAAVLVGIDPDRLERLERGALQSEDDERRISAALLRDP